MFDLEQAISEWRRRLGAGGLETPEVLNELESHLRDDVAAQVESGSDLSAAFAAAVQRLGEPGLLLAEFGKTRASALQRLEVLAFVGGGLLYVALAAFGLLRQDMGAAERVMGFAALACAVVLSLGLRRAARRLRRSKKFRQSLAVAGGSLGAVWMLYFALFLLQDLNLLPGPLLVTVLWGLNPTLACAAFGWGLQESRPAERHLGRA